LSLISDKFTPSDKRMKYTMSTKELAWLAVIKGAIDRACTVKQAARKLGVSARRVKHLKKTVREQGDGAFIHGNSRRHPENLTDEAIQKKIIALKKSGLCNKANFTRLRELLEEHEQIKISYTCLSGILSGNGGRSLGNSFKWTPLRSTGLVPAFISPYMGFRMTRPGTSWGCTCASTSAFRGISRPFWPFYKAMERQKPPGKGAY
jgi:transposase